jgi:thiol-disulfide isomerase/thioredoxin
MPEPAPTRPAWYDDLVRFLLTALLGVTSILGCGGAQAPVAPAPEAPASRGESPSSDEPEKLRFPPHAVQAVPDGPGWLGVELELRGPAEAGVLVKDILPSSPAAVAGIAPGDVILSVDGEQVLRPPDVVRIVSSHRPGERVALVLERQGKTRLLAVGLAARPDMDDLLAAEFVGKPAPAWRGLTAVQGSVPVDVSALRGRVVVVEFWASWCMVCRMTFPLLNRWHDRYGARGLTVVGVTTDPAAQATAASIELGISYAVHSDPDEATTRVYRARAIPMLFVIDRDGAVKDVVVGYQSDRFAQVEATVERLLATP